MNEQKIQDLLQRYFDGATSLDEERELQRFFTGGNIPDALMAYKPLFAYFAEERAVEPPAQKPEARIVRLKWAFVAGIAASIAILFMVGVPTDAPPDHYAYFVDGHRVYDETAALESAEDKLQMLAASMQKARNSMSALEKVQESNQSLQQFEKISNAYRQILEQLTIDN